jgi:hypothetical protein
MNPMKRAGLKLFSLCVLALGLVAFSATAAQADGTWMVKGVDLTSGTKALVGKLKNNTGTLLSALGFNKVDFTCATSTLVNANLEAGGAISEASKNAKVAFGVCITKINGVEAKACQPKATGKVAGTIETEEFYGLLNLHKLEFVGASDAIIGITPKVGTVLTVIHMGDLCAIGDTVKVFGSLALKDVGGNTGLLEEKQIHEVLEFNSLNELKVGDVKSLGSASLDGTAEIELSTKDIWNGLYK